MLSLKEVTGSDCPIIGMVHFPPLPGYPDHPGMDVCLNLSLQNARILKEGGVDAIMVENNYDLPHTELISKETQAAMAELSQAVKEEVNLPLGISILWNDYSAAFSIAHEVGAKFIRVPVFVDDVTTHYGVMSANPRRVVDLKRETTHDSVAFWADVQVKHAEMITPRPLDESVQDSIQEGADGIIVTGKWTANAPNLEDLETARKAAGTTYPILIGSGATRDNLKQLLQFADGVIVGTAIKSGTEYSAEVQTNIHPWEDPIDLNKTKDFVQTFKQITKRR